MIRDKLFELVLAMLIGAGMYMLADQKTPERVIETPSGYETVSNSQVCPPDRGCIIPDRSIKSNPGAISQEKPTPQPTDGTPTPNELLQRQ